MSLFRRVKQPSQVVRILAGLLMVTLIAPLAHDDNIGLVRAQTLSSDLALRAEPAALLQVELGKHSAPIRRLVADAARAVLITASDDKTARVWNLKTGALRTVLRPPIGAGDQGRLYGAALHPTEPLVALGGVTLDTNRRHWIYFFDINTGQLKQAIDAESGRIRRLVWSSDGSVLMAAYSGLNGLRAFSRTGMGIFRKEFSGAAYGLSVMGDQIAATDLDGFVRIFKVAGEQVSLERDFEVGKYAPVSVALSPDKARIVVGYNLAGKAPEVFDINSAKIIGAVALPKLAAGNAMTVAWSQDGQSIFVGGSGYLANARTPIFVFDARSMQQKQMFEVAKNSIHDLVPVGADIAFASADGSWGLLNGKEVTLRVDANNSDFRGAANLKISADARKVGWTFDWGHGAASIDLDRRVIVEGYANGLEPAVTSSGLLGPSTRNWQDHTAPVINGRTFDLAREEVSRAVAFLPLSGDVVWGTSFALSRLAADGRSLWRIATGSEVLAVNVSRDERLIVTAQAVGTICWWRAHDGRLLLTLFPTRDRKWLIWTPAGHFDASPGADQLAGWVRSHGASQESDFVSLHRLRARFNRPDVIERVLQALDVDEAVRLADRDSSGAVATNRPTQIAPATILALAPVDTPSANSAKTEPESAQAAAAQDESPRLPPTISPSGVARFKEQSTILLIPFALKDDSKSGSVSIAVRKDGRPVREFTRKMPSAMDGRAAGAVEIAIDGDETSIQILASNGAGLSEPLVISVPTLSSAPAKAKLDQITVPPGNKPRLFVLSVGISKYLNKDYELGLPAKDARDFVRAMQRQKGLLYSDVIDKTLTDGNASKQSVLDALSWLQQAPAKGDIGILFLAGHGMNSKSRKYYFLPVDGRHDDLENTSVAEDSIRFALTSMKGRPILFIDTCFAGKSVGPLASVRKELDRVVNDFSSVEHGVTVFASSQGQQVSEEHDAWGNGAFTKAAVDGILGKADLTNRGRITFKGLDYFISEEVTRLTDGRQTPVSLGPPFTPDFTLAITTGKGS